MAWMLTGMSLSLLVALFACWLGYELARQNGRVLLRLEALEKRPAPAEPAEASSPPRGLAVGSQAPAFELPDLAGRRRPLSEWRGRPVLLIFFNPRCGFCSRMAPNLDALPIDPAGGRPLPLVVTTGRAEENHRLLREIGRPVLLDERGEIAARYLADGTPMGYLIDARGRIASEVAVGAEALLALARGEGGAAADPSREPPGSNGQRSHKGNRSLENSRVNRDGLPAGTPAPSFRLPDLNGGHVALDEYRGRRVLLVFSDPDCGPCDHLAPQLQAAFGVRPSVSGQRTSTPNMERRTPSTAPAILMVTRGDIKANRRKAEAAGLTFPIVLQKRWEISKQYAMFATPIAYLIDEEGNTLSEVAVGGDAILALLAGAPARELASAS